ncbi:MAG: Na+/H+ antiporter subunit D [Bacteroidetes bacterium]|nr:MAG: Na+/H+ antiporter subunit D [Bacteroidota bacterium]
MKLKNLIISFLVILIGWFMLTWSLELKSVLIGVGLSVILSLLFCGQCTIFSEMKLTPKAIIYTFIYLFVFLVELVKANIDVTRRVLSPKMPINPGIVKVDTHLKSKMARLILANSITLTPGTFTLEVHEDTFYIHWIDVKHADEAHATEDLIRKFEKLLEEIYE